MVNVAHDHDHRRALDQIFGRVGSVLKQALLNGDMHLVLYLCAKFVCHQCGGIKIHHVRQGRHHAKAHQLFNDLRRGLLEAQRQFGDADLVRHHDLQLGLARFFKLQALQTLGLGLALFRLQRPAVIVVAVIAVVAAAKLLLAAGADLLLAVLVARCLCGTAGGGAGKVFIFFVKLVEVDVAAAGVHPHGHNFALRLFGLGRLFFLRRLKINIAAAGALQLDHGAVCFFQRLGRYRRRLVLRGAGKIVVKVFHFGLFGVMLEHEVEFFFGQRGRVLFAFAEFRAYHLEQFLVLQCEVFCDFAGFVFNYHISSTSISGLYSAKGQHPGPLARPRQAGVVPAAQGPCLSRQTRRFSLAQWPAAVAA